ncbi:AAA family ATPase [Lactobacillus delbrueckii subsp. bulgaricus]
MLLRAVELHNFRGYRNFKLKFAPLTSLLGEGEVGKKTILRALDISLDIFLTALWLSGL